MIQGKKIVTVVLAAAAMATVTIILTSVALVYRDCTTYPSNCYVDGVAIGGLSRSQTERMLDTRLNARSQNWYLKFPDKILTLSVADCGIELDKQATMQKIDSVMNQKKGLPGIIDHSISRGQRINLAVVYCCNRDILYDQLNKMQDRINRPAINARILYNKGLLEYIPQQNGYILDLDATVSRICTALRNGYKGPFDAAIINLYPAVKIEDIQSVKDVIGAYAAAGLSEAAVAETQRVNGTIIMPGQIFTLDTAGNDSLPGMQRAINAIMKACEEAGVTILSPPSDKQVIIQNNLNDPVLFSIVLCDETMQIKILGCQTEPGKKIHLTTEEQEIPPKVRLQTDKSLQPQERVLRQQGKPGTIVRTYRLVTVKGKLVEKTLLAQETNPGTDTIIGQGPHAPGK